MNSREEIENGKKDNQSNPIIDAFNKMMGDEMNEEYNKHFKADLENDDDFYDEHADSEDEKEATEKLKSHFIDKPIESDAVLLCPGCMTVLTIDCQQHETFKQQFRAMFVENCRIDDTESVICPKIGKKTDSSQSNPNDVFHPVFCSMCPTKVGMIDHKSVYHFFNVLPSD